MKKRLVQTTTGSPGFPRRSRRARPESALRERPRRRPPPSAGMLAPSRGEEERTTRTPLGGCWKRGWRRRRGISRRAPRTPGPPTTKTAPRSRRARLAAPSPFAAAARRAAAGASRLGSWTPPSSRTSVGSWALCALAPEVDRVRASARRRAALFDCWMAARSWLLMRRLVSDRPRAGPVAPVRGVPLALPVTAALASPAGGSGEGKGDDEAAGCVTVSGCGVVVGCGRGDISGEPPAPAGCGALVGAPSSSLPVVAPAPALSGWLVAPSCRWRFLCL